MALNPQYDAIGKGFVQQYYALFDDPAQRPNLANLYNVETSFMTFEGVQLQGALKIMEKLNITQTEAALTAYHGHVSSILSYGLDGWGNSVDVERVFKVQTRCVCAIVNARMGTSSKQYSNSPTFYLWLGLGFQKIGRFITSIDSQPMFDGGVLINVLGRLQCDDDPPHSYMQTFVLKALGDSFFVQHDIFRLCIHDVA